MKSVVSLIMLSFLLHGCLGKQNPIKNDVIFIQSIPVCHTAEVCDAIWKAAGEWVDEYSPQGTDVFESDLIRSETPELGSNDMDMEIKKVQQKDGSYKIIINNSCARSWGSCESSRRNMIAFNKKMVSLLPANEKAIKEKVFIINTDVNKWLNGYASSIAQYDAESLASMLHFPVSYIEKDEIKVLNSIEDMGAYIKDLKNSLSKLDGQSIKVNDIDVFARNGRNIYVNAVLSLEDSEGATVGAQQLGFHLVKIDKKLKMISAGTHTE